MLPKFKGADVSSWLLDCALYLGPVRHGDAPTLPGKHSEWGTKVSTTIDGVPEMITIC